jgi:mono/diheme cytochrome c family protein
LGFKLLLKRSSLFFVPDAEQENMRSIFLILLVGIIQACQQRSLPTITTRTAEPERPVSKVSNVTPDAAIGKTIFTNRCSKCHALPDPVQYSSQRWDGILSVMNLRARLNEEQVVHVTAYIKANCLK